MTFPFNVDISEDFHDENQPGFRYYCTVLQFSLETIFLFGGGVSGQSMHDLWEFNTKKRQWRMRNHLGLRRSDDELPTIWSDVMQPTGRRSGVMMKNVNNANRFFLIFGSRYSDVWEYDINYSKWRMVRESSNIEIMKYNTSESNNYYFSTDWNSEIQPSGRGYGQSWIMNFQEDYYLSSKLGKIPNGALFYFGGYSVNSNGNAVTYNKEFWIYDQTTNSFLLINRGNGFGFEGNFNNESNTFSIHNQPATRLGGSTWHGQKKDELFMFGGQGPNFMYFQDLWVFSINTTEWKWIIGINKNYNTSSSNGNAFVQSNSIDLPSARSFAVTWEFKDPFFYLNQNENDNFNSKIYLFGGDWFIQANGTISDNYLNDLWEFNFLTNEFSCLLYCSDIENLNYEYNSSFPTKIPSRSAGNAFFDSNGNLLEFSGGWGNYDIWQWNDPNKIEKCQNLSIYSEFSCSSNGNCFNSLNETNGDEGTCVCKDDKYWGNQCQYWQCFGVNNTDSSVCNEDGFCSDYNTCLCNANYGENCEFYELSCFGMFANASNVCNSQGNCSNLNFCQCNQFYYGDQCEEKINNARMIYNGASILIDYEVSLFAIDSIYISDCSSIIFNSEKLGNDHFCYWKFTDEKTTTLTIFTGTDHSFQIGQEILVIPFAAKNETDIVRLVLTELPYEVTIEDIVWWILLATIIISGTLIFIILLILIFLVYKNISLFVQLRRQNNRIRRLFKKPYLP